MKKGIFKSLLLSLAIFCGFNLISTVNNAVKNNEVQTIENRKINIKKSSTKEVTVTKTYTLSAEDFPTEGNKNYSFLCGHINVDVKHSSKAPLIDFVEGTGAKIQGGTRVTVTPISGSGITVIDFSINRSKKLGLGGVFPENATTYNPTEYDNYFICKITPKNSGTFGVSFANNYIQEYVIGFSVTYKYPHSHNPTWQSNDETHHWKECECG